MSDGTECAAVGKECDDGSRQVVLPPQVGIGSGCSAMRIFCAMAAPAASTAPQVVLPPHGGWASAVGAVQKNFCAMVAPAATPGGHEHVQH